MEHLSLESLCNQKKRAMTGNSDLAKVGVQYFADTFEVDQTLVLHINNRHLRRTLNRQRQV